MRFVFEMSNFFSDIDRIDEIDSTVGSLEQCQNEKLNRVTRSLAQCTRYVSTKYVREESIDFRARYAHDAPAIFPRFSNFSEKKKTQYYQYI